MAVVYDTGWISGTTARAGVPFRMGLVRPGDPQVATVTARTDWLGSRVTRSEHTRELVDHGADVCETIESMTLLADGPIDYPEVLLGWATFR